MPINHPRGLTSHIVFRHLAGHRTRALLTALGIALGVAAVVAVAVVRDSALRSVAGMFDQAAGLADLSVTSATAGIVGGEGFDDAALQAVRGVEGLEQAAPLLQVITLPAAQLDRWQWSYYVSTYSGMLLYGLDPRASRAMGHYRLGAGQDLPQSMAGTILESILLTESYARELDLELGDSLELVTPSGTARFQLTGFLAPEGLARLNRGQVGLVLLETARAQFARQGLLDQIDIQAVPGVEVDALQARLEAALGGGYSVFRPASKGALVDQMLQATTVGMNLAGLFALLLGALIIYNTFATTVVERTRELGLLRALGSGRGQIVRLVLAEAGLLGLGSGLLGLLGGLALAAGMRHLVAAAVNVELAELVVTPAHLVVGLALGLAVSLAAALPPALRAGRLSPVEALQRHPGDGSTPSPRGTAAGLALLLPGLAVVVAYPLHPVDISAPVMLLLIALLEIGAILLIPAFIPPLERLAGGLLGLVGVEGLLGGRNLARRPGRAALTAGALVVGLVAVIGGGAVTAAADQLSRRFVDTVAGGDLFIYGPQPLPQSLVGLIEEMDGVRAAVGVSFLPTRFLPSDPPSAQIAVLFLGTDLSRYGETTWPWLFVPGGGSWEQARPRLLQGGALLVESPLAERYGLRVGDRIRLQTVEGPRDFEVAGIVFGYTSGGFATTGTFQDAARYLGTDRVSIVKTLLQPGQDVGEVSDRILDRWGETYHLRTETHAQWRARMLAEGRRASASGQLLVVVCVVVVALGVLNTMLTNVLERRRELAILRSQGMTRRQVIKLVLAEAAALGLLGGILGIGLGLLVSRFAVAASTGLLQLGLDLPYVLPAGALLAGVLIALLVPLLAGLWPAWRAARAGIVEAIRTE